MGVRCATAAVLAALLLPARGLASPPSSKPSAIVEQPTVAIERALRRAGRSIGTPWKGALREGRKLRQGARVRYLRRYAGRGNFWGIDALVGLIERSAGAVAARWPGSRLSVGELSARRGGYLRGHKSHRSGRDADLGFYVRDRRGRFARLQRFLGFGRRAPLSPAARVRFDDARNWALVKALLTDRHARVQYLFVSRPIRARLLAHGRRSGESAHLLRSAAAVLVEPAHAETHDDHFHLRIYCPADQRAHCQDAEPYWPWFEGTPPGGTYARLPTIRWRPAVPDQHAALSDGRAPRAANPRPSR